MFSQQPRSPAKLGPQRAKAQGPSSKAERRAPAGAPGKVKGTCSSGARSTSVPVLGSVQRRLQRRAKHNLRRWTSLHRSRASDPPRISLLLRLKTMVVEASQPVLCSISPRCWILRCAAVWQVPQRQGRRQDAWMRRPRDGERGNFFLLGTRAWILSAPIRRTRAPVSTPQEWRCCRPHGSGLSLGLRRSPQRLRSKWL